MGAIEEPGLVNGLTRLLPEIMEDHATPGLSIALARHGRVFWRAGFGFANLARAEPMTPETLLRGGSMSKLYTAIAVLQLIEQGILGLHDSVNDHLGPSAVTNPRGRRPVTVYDLLTFQSGLERDTTDCSFAPAPTLGRYVADALRGRSLKEYAGTIARWAGPVGEAYRYSNLGVSVLGRLVEIANPRGLSFERYIDDNIVQPLGMRSTLMPSTETMACLPPALAKRMSTGYAIFGRVRVPSPTIHAAAAPATNLLTTPGEHVRLLLALLNGGELDGGRVLSAESVALMTTPQVPITLPEFTAPGTDWWQGLGVRLNARDRQDFSFGHGGAYVWGWWADARAYPVHGLAVAVAANGWNMVQWHVPGSVTPHELVFRYVTETLSSPRPPSTPARSLGWRLSYLIGLIMVERCRGLLGIGDPVTCDMIAAMAGEADVQDPAGDLWDRDGFVAGARAMTGVGTSPEAIRDFLASPALGVPREEIPALFARLRGIGDLPVPVSFWEHTLPPSDPRAGASR
jgi:CubicO group peptidase (beta-lactamase class C family)